MRTFAKWIVCALVLSGVGHVTAQTKLRIAYSLARDATYGVGVDAFDAKLRELTQGRYVVEHFPGGGDELDSIKKVQAGELELANTSTGPLGVLVPEVKVLDLPFLFTSYGHARSMLDGPAGTALLEKLPAYNLRGLAWTENGFRHITNNRRPIVRPVDLNAMNLRTMQNTVHMNSFKALNSTPTPLAFGKLMEALKVGTLDGQENPLPVILSSKIHQSQKYLSLTQHFYSAGVLTVSPKLWEKLSPADKEAFLIAARAGAKAQRRKVNIDELTALTSLKEAGMAINSHVDLTAFRVALRPMYPELLPGLDMQMLHRIQNPY